MFYWILYVQLISLFLDKTNEKTDDISLEARYKSIKIIIMTEIDTSFISTPCVISNVYQCHYWSLGSRSLFIQLFSLLKKEPMGYECIQLGDVASPTLSDSLYKLNQQHPCRDLNPGSVVPNLDVLKTL